jgi:hypothetical protein
MTNVGRATQGTGGADQPAPTDGAAHSERVEAGSHATPRGESPALQDAPQRGYGRDVTFSVLTPADNVEARAHLTNFRYTAKQLASVEAKHGSAGLEALRRAHGNVSTALMPSEQAARREQLTEIACGNDGVNVLRALSRHWETLVHSTTLRNVLKLAEEQNGATKLASLADLVDSGYTYTELADAMKEHSSAILEHLSAAHGKLSPPLGSSPEEALALRERLLAIACRKDGMTVLNALSDHGQMLSKIATVERILDVAERPQGATDLVTLAGTHRALADDIRRNVRDAARPH